MPCEFSDEGRTHQSFLVFIFVHAMYVCIIMRRTVFDYNARLVCTYIIYIYTDRPTTCTCVVTCNTADGRNNNYRAQKKIDHRKNRRMIYFEIKTRYRFSNPCHRSFVARPRLRAFVCSVDNNVFAVFTSLSQQLIKINVCTRVHSRTILSVGRAQIKRDIHTYSDRHVFIVCKIIFVKTIRKTKFTQTTFRVRGEHCRQNIIIYCHRFNLESVLRLSMLTKFYFQS